MNSIFNFNCENVKNSRFYTPHITLIVFLFISLQTISQNKELTAADIAPFAYSFKLDNSTMNGAGADTLKKAISHCQFFMLGEQHYSPQISELTNALLPIFSLNGYKNFALEIGSFTAKVIQSEMMKQHSLYPFTHSFYEKYKEKPVPFFDGTKDEVFLQNALRLKFNLWGLDQEYLSSPLFLIDEIYHNSKNKSATKTAYLKAKKYLEQEFILLNKEKENHYFNMFDGVNDFTTYIKQCSAPKQQEIIKSLKISMNIYKGNKKGNNEVRMEYMKQNFSSYYKQQPCNSLPKVFFKMGSMHLGRGKSWLDIYDLGNMIHELGYFNNSKAISINCYSRYTEQEDGSVFDNMDDEDEKDLSLLMSVASKDEWVLIDSRKIDRKSVV